MTVLQNPLLRIPEAAAGGDDYQIEKSLRFNHSDNAHLQKGFSKGNTRLWTFSTWIKRSLITNQSGTWQAILEGAPNGSNMSWISWASDDKIQFQTITAGSFVCSATTNGVFRDPSAWYHVCIVFDSNQDEQADRYKVYINGKFVSTNQDNAIEKYQESWINKDSKITIGGGPVGNGPSYYVNGYLADTHLIDGLALSPAAFGSFDSLGVWNPKAFALPAINANQDWLSMVDGTTDNASFPIARMFDGTGENKTLVEQPGSHGQDYFTFTPTGGIEYTTSVEVIIAGSVNQHTSINGWQGAGGVLTPYDAGWVTIAEGKGTINTMEFGKVGSSAAGDGVWIQGIRVDGVILKQTSTDPTTRNNPNNGTEWSDYVTLSTGSWDGGDDPGSGFDGSFSTAAENGTAHAVISFDPPGGISYNNRIEVWGGYGQWRINSGSWSGAETLNGNAWTTLATGSGTLNKLEIKGTDADGWAKITVLKIDGHHLVDKTVDNSFHLKYSDNSRKENLGNDTLNGKIEDANGGLPILKTKAGTNDNDIDYGHAIDTGYRTDSSAGTSDGTGLVYANPLTSVDGDVHHEINTGSTKKTTTTWYSIPDVVTDSSRFYGSSMRFTGAPLIQVHPSGQTADFEMGTGAFTIEMWVKVDDTSQSDGFFQLGGDSGWAANGISLATYNSGWEVYLKDGSNHNFNSGGSGTAPSNKWCHIALTRDGSNKFRLWVDGAEKGSLTQSKDFDSSWGGYMLLGAHEADSNKFTGNLQDVRIYKGVEKYSTPFTPPARNDFAVNNLTAGAETTNADFNWRPGVAIGTDASRKNNTINNYKLSGDGVVQSGTTGKWRASQSVTKTSGGGAGYVRWDDWWGISPGNGQNGSLLYAGREDTEFTFDPPVTSDVNITARCDQNGGSTGDDKVRFYDGGTSTWTSWFDITQSANISWTNIATGIQRIDKVGFDCGGATDSNLAGFYLDSGLTDANWWRLRDGADWGITTAGVFEKDAGTNINGDAATTIPSQYTLDYWHCPEWYQKGNGTVFDTETEQTIRDYGSNHSSNTCQRTIKITSTDDNTVYDYYYTTKACRWNHVRITPTGVWANGTQLQNSQASNYNVPDITASSHRFTLGNYGVTASSSYSYDGLIGPCRLVEADLGAPPAGGLVVTDEAGSSTNTTTNTPTTNTESDYDNYTDSPTTYEGSGDDVGGVMRGNYATMNPIARTFNDNLRDITNGGLLVEGNSSSNSGIAESTWNQKTGKWYMEFTYVNDPNDGYSICGMYNTGYTSHHGTGDGSGTSGSACVNISTNTSVFGSVLTTGDVMGMAADLDNGACYFSKNGTWVGTPTSGGSKTGATATWTAGDKSKCIGVIDTYKSGNKVACNWGQRAFKYTPPTGFKSCCTQNLSDTFSGEDDAVVNNPSKYFDNVKYTGTGADGNEVDGLSFQPELVWIKDKDSAGNHHRLYDAIRGVNSALIPSLANAADQYADYGQFESFDSDGFTVGAGNTNAEGTNHTNQPHIAWAWDAGTSASGANTAGTINIASGDQWVNNIAGFSMTKYTGNNTASQSIGHGLNAAPEFILIKKTDASADWHVGHNSIGWEKHLYLGASSQTVAEAIPQDDANVWSDTAPTNTLWYTGANGSVNGNNNVHIAYCWTPIPGYSAFGKYTANNVDDGPFIWCGFSPKWILFKNITSAWGWYIHDTIMNPTTNVSGQHLIANRPNAQSNWDVVDILSNGFKLVKGASEQWNYQTNEYIYAAFAEHPFKNARAR